MRIVISGATGKLGTEIASVALEKNIQAIALPRIDNSYAPLSRKTFVPQNEATVLVESCKEECVFCDVSVPAGTENLCHALLDLPPELQRNIKGMVIGTTGHNKQQLAAITSLSEHVPVILSPNFSLGIMLVDAILKAKTQYGLSVAELAAKLGFETAIWESHHSAKRDAPSGTAKQLAKSLDLSENQITSTRVGKVIGEHQVIWSGDSEEIRLSHTAHTRRLFAIGAIDLCERIDKYPTLKPQVYNRDDFYK